MIDILPSDPTTLRLVRPDGPSRDIAFPAPLIRAFATAEGRHVLVLTDPPAGHAGANLYCLAASDGEVLWQRDADKSRSPDNIYTSIQQLDAALVRAWDWNGYRETIEIPTGTMVERCFVK